MAVHVDYDTDTRTIFVTTAPVNGVVEIDIQIDLYSDMKEDWRSNAALNKFKLPISSVGGQPLPGSRLLGDTYFLDDLWKIRPYEANHKLALNGNLFSKDGTSIMVPTIGNYQVLAEMFVSNLTDSSIAQLSDIEYASFGGKVTIDVIRGTTLIEGARGNGEDPVNNLEDALVVAAEKGIHDLFVVGNMIIASGEDVTRFTITGQDPALSTIMIENGAITPFSIFKKCTLTGDANGTIQAFDCSVAGLVGVGDAFTEVVWTNCGIDGGITLDAAATAGFHMVNCHSDTIGHGGENIDLNSANCEILVIGWAGGIQFSNWNQGQNGSIEVNTGHVFGLASCTDGHLVIHGGTMYSDLTTGTFEFDIDGVINEDTIAIQVWKELTVGNVTPGSFGEASGLILKYNDNLTKFFDSNGTTEVIQGDAFLMVTFDNDGITPLKSIEFRDDTDTPVKLSEATRYVKL